MSIQLLSGIFLEGILSFLSPCVLPLIPLYISYLAGENKTVDEEGNVKYDRVKVFISTIFFTLGISLTFVILAASVNVFKDYLNKYTEIISIIGGTVIIIFGLHELGLIHIDILNKELKLKYDTNLSQMNYLKAFMLGFVFSLGWSPCIGPMLANALLLSATSSNGYIYILFYALGLIIPFLITGLFTSTVLNFINSKKHIIKYITKIAGVVLILFGIYMIYNASKTIVAAKDINNSVNNETSQQMSREEVEDYLLNLELKDVDGNIHKLADYNGKYLFLNFTTTWCTYCKAEIPEYVKFAENEEVECLYIMSPRNENSDDAISRYVVDNNINLTTIVDEKGELFYYCGISGYPTAFVVAPDGSFLTYVSGALTYDNFNSLLDYSKGLVEEKEH